MAPVLSAVPPSGHLVVREGESATLECRVKRGNPAPQVTWRRKVRKRVHGVRQEVQETVYTLLEHCYWISYAVCKM